MRTPTRTPMTLHEALAVILMLLAFIISAPSISSATASNSVTVSVHPTTVPLGGNFTVSGNVTAESGAVGGTSVFIKVVDYFGTLMASANASVTGSGGSGTYSGSFATGGTGLWGAGSYTAEASYGIGSAAVSNSTTFNVVAITCCVSTSTVTATSTANESVIYGEPVITQGFVSHYNYSVLDVYLWVSAMDSRGQTVGVFIGSATMEPSVPIDVGAVLFNLPSDLYTATVFLTTTNGIVLSSTSTTTEFRV